MDVPRVSRRSGWGHRASIASLGADDVQGLYYTATGLWPLLHMPSFIAVTGPKRELWLVRAAAGLIVSVGLGLLSSGPRASAEPGLRAVAIGSALTLAAVDLVYGLTGRIPRAYLADAAVQLAILVLWTRARRPGPALATALQR
jgi:hypothetical protein